MNTKALKITALVSTALFGCICLAADQGVTSEQVQTFFGAAISHQITQFTVAFTAAAWVHSGRVKKEIANQCQSMVTSLDGVAQALRKDLAAQTSRIGSIEEGVLKLNGRVDKLEKQPPVITGATQGE